MTLRRATSGLAALLLALLVAASGLLPQSSAAQGTSGQKDLRANDALIVIVAPQVRTLLPAPDGTDDPGFIVCVPDHTAARDTGAVFAPDAALIRIYPILIPPSRGPPAAML
jgi:hypothetical protein